MKRPRCEKKGTVPHPATNTLTWDLQSGRVTKFFCDDHSVDVSPQPYRISKLVGYFQRKKTAPVKQGKPFEQLEAEGMLRIDRTYTLVED